MSKTITVKGIGKVSASPDNVIIFMNLDSRDSKYEKAMKKASDSIEMLKEALNNGGFEKKELKTQNFNLNTVYEAVQDKDGTFRNVFKGYAVYHSLKLEFEFDPQRLSDAIAAISTCSVHPQLSLEFTVKDASAVNEALLRSAAVNAKEKAKVLCEASGKKLGELLSIDYSWNEKNLRSDTNYALSEECCGMPMAAKGMAVDFTPQDINVSDTVVFVWEITE